MVTIENANERGIFILSFLIPYLLNFLSVEEVESFSVKIIWAGVLY